MPIIMAATGAAGLVAARDEAKLVLLQDLRADVLALAFGDRGDLGDRTEAVADNRDADEGGNDEQLQTRPRPSG
ncbi:hypothetical protein [Actinomadura sp. 21ATH]|uniref:hypothetical protein n=1 Tax=Actinomadura sp. 21ATH TaxID=1735444 RepID=UPI0035C146AA